MNDVMDYFVGGIEITQNMTLLLILIYFFAGNISMIYKIYDRIYKWRYSKMQLLLSSIVLMSLSCMKLLAAFINNFVLKAFGNIYGVKTLANWISVGIILFLTVLLFINVKQLVKRKKEDASQYINFRIPKVNIMEIFLWCWIFYMVFATIGLGFTGGNSYIQLLLDFNLIWILIPVFGIYFPISLFGCYYDKADAFNIAWKLQ